MFKLLALAALLAVASAAEYPQIKEFTAISSTLNSVTLSWSLDITEFVPVKYTLIVDGILTIEFFHDGSGTYTVTGLSSCNRYEFDLTADYEGGEQGEAETTYGDTEYEMPGSVGDLTVDGSTVSWTAPTNARCVEYYTVCYVSAVTEDTVCTEGVLGTSYDLGTVSACDELDVTVAAVGGDLTGEPSSVHVVTEEGLPGMPRNVEVVPLTDSSVLLAWDPPLENPACVQDYAIVFGPVNNFTTGKVSHEEDVSMTEDDEEEDGMAEGPSGQQETAILDNLFPCTDYRFGVASVSPDNVYSNEVVVYLSTNGSAPGLLPDVSFDTSEDSITISWGDVSEEACLDVIQICYVDPVDHTWNCIEVPSSPNTWTLDGLGACREYDITLTGVSPEGESGDSVVIHVPTKDVAPGPVQNLALSLVEMTSVTMTFDAPLEYPDCVDQYVETYKNIMDEADERSVGIRDSTFTIDIDGLDACALYEFGVYAVSPTGIDGVIDTVRTLLKQGTPDPPAGGSFVTSTETTLTVLWFAPTDTRFCVDTYEVRVSEDGSGSSVSVEALEFNTQILHTFTDLNPCKSYQVQIRSINSETDSMSPYDTVLTNAMTVC